ncbi:unnamed protein product [Callosobruchus maculatus]|uniref:C2H2-type domain-containing protein n=1 Tax=Callosobruchus maculatus TaxID=64391 RepID=A0A653D5D5_CALMS|nr:unnamed protein product [Callosobruchus maculatus]
MDSELLQIKVEEETSDSEDDVFIEEMDTNRYVGKESLTGHLQHIDLKVNLKKEDDVLLDRCKTEINANCLPFELEYMEELHIKTECNISLENEKIHGCNTSSTRETYEEKSRNRSRRRCYHRPRATPQKEQWFVCTACPYKTKYPANLVRHQLVHGKTDKKPLFCYNCEYKTYRKYDLVSHMYKHSKNKKVYSCNSCSHTTFRKYDLKAHILRVHGDEYNLITRKCCCIYCNKTFKEKRAVEDHIIKCHPNFIHTVSSKILECSQCAFKTTYKSSLTQHMHKLKHCLGDAPVYTCNICDYVCYFRKYFNVHLKSHTRTNRYRCSSCECCWPTKQKLDEHILCDHRSCDELVKTVSCKIYKCEKCGYITVYLLKYKKHVKLHNTGI